MSERRAVIRAAAAGYRKAGKKRKGQWLDELVALTGYHRWYVVRLLRAHGRILRRVGRVRLIADVGLKARRGRRPVYDAAVVKALRSLWMILDCLCGKRLKAILPEAIEALERHREIRLSVPVRRKLLAVSAATIDRLLAPDRAKMEVRGRSGTKPGTLLRHPIPIRTFTEWDNARPGFLEIDLVGHDGGVAGGDFCQTLDATDVASGWTETQAVLNKAQVWVFEALKDIRSRLPCALLGIDSDNGSEFINHPLLDYCQQEHLTFTRARAYRKNDGCFIEQKNYSVVRRSVGYARYEGAGDLMCLNELYRHLRLYTNFFQPVMKLIQKERHGATVKKTYDAPKTPYRRLLTLPGLSKTQRLRLDAQYAQLNPAQLKRDITRLQHRLIHRAHTRSTTGRHRPGPPRHDARAQPSRKTRSDLPCQNALV
jgi:hypothetical protein